MFLLRLGRCAWSGVAGVTNGWNVHEIVVIEKTWVFGRGEFRFRQGV